MMKLKLGDVLEYVRAGEDDPNMGSVLRQHPDGPELLEQARLMLGIMRLRSPRRPDRRADESAVSLDAPVELSPQMIVEPAEVRRMYEPTVTREESPRGPYNTLWETRRSRGQLGTLIATRRGERVEISFKPGPGRGKSGYGQGHGISGTPGLEIRGSRFTITLADTLPEKEGLVICLTDRALRKPVEGIELIFMPDTGPFEKLSTDSNGTAELAPPLKPGVLRIASRPTELLRIKLA